MIARLGARLSMIAARFMPSPLALALGLSVLSVGAAILFMVSDGLPVVTSSKVVALGWFHETTKSSLLAFAFKMALILVTGHALATSRPARLVIDKLAQLPKTGVGAAVIVAVVACIASVIHWGFGAIVGALFAREIATCAHLRDKVNYPLLGAAAYSGFAVWHGGLSGSAPLDIAGQSVVFTSSVPLSQTIFSGTNLVLLATSISIIAVLVARMAAGPADDAAQPPTRPEPKESAPPMGPGLIAKLQHHFAVGLLFGLVGFAAIIYGIALGPLKLNLNTVVFIFLFLSLAAQGSLHNFSQATTDGAKACGAILVQFPLYFGIKGALEVSGIVQAFSEGIANAASATTFPPLAFFSAGAANLLIPSGGGQWAVQGKVLMDAGGQLSVDPATTVLAFSYGDAWTNMLQPFWALPLLGIMGLSARDIVGYTAVIWLALGLAIPTLLLIL